MNLKNCLFETEIQKKIEKEKNVEKIILETKKKKNKNVGNWQTTETLLLNHN